MQRSTEEPLNTNIPRTRAQGTSSQAWTLVIAEVAASTRPERARLGTRKESDFRIKLGEQPGIDKIQEEAKVIDRKHDPQTSLEQPNRS